MIIKSKVVMPGFLLAVLVYISSYFLSNFFGTELLGTHIELEPDNKITKNEIKELMKEIVSNEEEQNA